MDGIWIGYTAIIRLYYMEYDSGWFFHGDLMGYGFRFFEFCFWIEVVSYSLIVKRDEQFLVTHQRP